MKRWMSVLLTVVMVVALVMSMSPAAFAYGDSVDTDRITVNVKLTGTLPNPAETYYFQILPLDASNPMPNGLTDGRLAVSGTGRELSNSFTITFDTVGIYTYKIYQVIGKNLKCHYDKSAYELVVYVTNNTDYTGLETTICIYPMKAILNSDGTVKEYVYDTKDGENKKTDNILFTNAYWVAPANTPSTGDESNVVLYALVSVLALATLTTGIVVLKRKKQ